MPSFPHLVVILLIALMVFGPEKLPELARMLGKAMAEFRRMTGDVRRVVDDEIREIERQTRESDARKREAPVAGQGQTQSQPAALPAADSGADAPAPSSAIPAERPSVGKMEALGIEPAPETEIEQDFSHVRHNPS